MEEINWSSAWKRNKIRKMLKIYLKIQYGGHFVYGILVITYMIRKVQLSRIQAINMYMLDNYVWHTYKANKLKKKWSSL